MGQFRALREIQLDIIKSLKDDGFSELSARPDAIEHCLGEGFQNCSMHIYKKSENGHIEIRVKFTDKSPVNMPPILAKMMRDNGVTRKESSSIDGFDIYPDGEILDMHPEEFDDD